MVEVEHYDTSPAYTGGGYNGCWGVYPFFPSGTIVASDRQEGLYVFGADCNPASRIEGTITDAGTGQPISGASIDVLNYDFEEANSDLTGFYSTGIAYCGTFDVVYSAPCYEPDTISINFVNDMVITQDVQLTYICCTAEDADAGDLVAPNGLISPLSICEGDDLSAFGNDYTANDESLPAVGFDYAYILANDISPTYNIIDFNQTGDFDFSTLAPGVYTIWGLSYSDQNAEPNILNYLNNLTPATVEQINKDITNLGLCADIEGLDATATQMQVIVNLPPIAEISPASNQSICPGDSVLLTALPAGQNYLWSNGSTTQSIYASTTGIYTVDVTDADGCVSTSNAVEVTNYLVITPSITASGPITICEGDDVVLSSSTAIGYIWSTGAATQNILVNTPGTFSVQTIDGNGCVSPPSQAVTVTVEPLPDASFATLASAYCVQDNAVSLVPTTLGGTFSGPGVSGTSFDPTSVPSNLWGTPIDIVYDITQGTCSNSSTQQIIVDNCITPGLQLTVRAYLEGAFINSSGTMKTKLLDDGLLPTAQPYNTWPWFYAGTESVTLFPTNTVDWVLVELRTGTPNLSGTTPNTSLVESVAGLLLENGDIVGVDGVTPLVFNNLSIGVDYYVVVRHRNHLDVMSSVPIQGAGSMVYDFTTGAGQALGTAQLKLLPTGEYVMFAGDYVGDGVLQVSDYNAWKLDPSVIYTYQQADGNMDGVVQTTDYDTWTINQAKLGIAEIRY